MQRARPWPPILACAALVACGEPAPPEQRLRALIAAAEAAVEEEDLAHLRGLIAEDYADRYGNDARSLTMLLRAYLLRHDAIHLLSRIERIEIAGDFAELTVLVGMVGNPADGWGLAGEVYQIEAQMRERDGEWQIVAGQWQRGLGRAPE